MKVQISLDDELMKRIDKYAADYYMSRSSFISYACTQFLNNSELSLAFIDLSRSMQKIADTGLVDDETRKQLEDFERLSRLFQSQR